MPSLGQPGRVAEKIKKLGSCIELVAIDPYFHDVTVGLFSKDGVLTISSYSTINGVEKESNRSETAAPGLEM